MSFMDKLKAMFSGSSSASEHDHSHDGHDHSHDAMEDVPAAPAAPMDPLGTTEPDPMPSEEDRSA
jgi:hypothetical protein